MLHHIGELLTFVLQIKDELKQRRKRVVVEERPKMLRFFKSASLFSFLNAESPSVSLLFCCPIGERSPFFFFVDDSQRKFVTVDALRREERESWQRVGQVAKSSSLAVNVSPLFKNPFSALSYEMNDQTFLFPFLILYCCCYMVHHFIIKRP